MKKTILLLSFLVFQFSNANSVLSDCNSVVNQNGETTTLRIQVLRSNVGISAVVSTKAKDNTVAEPKSATVLEEKIRPEFISNLNENADGINELEKLFVFIEKTKQMLMTPSKTNEAENLSALLAQFQLGFDYNQVSSAKGYIIGQDHPWIGRTYLIEPLDRQGKSLGRFIYAGFVTYKCE